MNWGKRFNEMDDSELRTAFKHHEEMFRNATTLAATAGATFPKTFVRNSKIADFNYNRMKLIANVARKAKIQLA